MLLLILFQWDLYEKNKYLNTSHVAVNQELGKVMENYTTI